MFLNLMKGSIRFGSVRFVSIVLYLLLYDDVIVRYVSLSSYDAFFTLPVAVDIMRMSLLKYSCFD